MSLLDPFSEGMEVEVSINIESREFNGKWFHNVTAWKIDSVGSTQNTTGGGGNYQSAVSPSGLPPSEMAFSNPDSGVEPESDDLPF